VTDAELRLLEMEIRSAPDAPDLLEKRARRLLRLGRTIDAAADLDLAVRLGAKHLRVELATLLDGLAIKDDRLNGTFRLIPGGPFLMGDDAGDEDEQPRHLVRLDPFYVCDAPFTAHFQDMHADQERARTLARRMIAKRDKYAARTGRDEHPMSFDWGVASALLDELTKQTGILHRFPTEAEWERVRRANLADLPYRVVVGTPWEFVSDHYDSMAYDAERGANGTRTNPRGPSKGEHRVVRGTVTSNENVPFVHRASWRDSASEGRFMPHGTRQNADHSALMWINFRVVRPVPQ
jgi:formylglycine-generating enzyme required for sulfatase activity